MNYCEDRYRKLLADAAGCDLIAELAVELSKREHFRKLAADYRELAVSLRRIILSSILIAMRKISQVDGPSVADINHKTALLQVEADPLADPAEKAIKVMEILQLQTMG